MKVPYIRNNQPIIAPPEGYFILPGDVSLLEGDAALRKVGDNRPHWSSIYLNSRYPDETVEERMTRMGNGNTLCYAREISNDENLYNQMSDTTIKQLELRISELSKQLIELKEKEKNRFSHGDKVKCLNTRVSTGSFIAGNIYEVDKHTRATVYVKADSNGGDYNGWNDVNFVKATPEEIAVDECIKLEKLKKKLLADAEAAGFKVGAVVTTTEPCMSVAMDNRRITKVFVGDGTNHKELGGTASALVREEGAPIVVVDLEGDLNYPIKYLVVVKNVLPVVDGNTMSPYVKGNNVVTFGCCVVSIALAREMRTLAQHRGVGNTTVAAIKLNNGHTISAEDIEKVLKYVDNVNNE